MGLERALRRIVPATATLTYNPIFKLVVDSFDLLPMLMYREVRRIPPNHMRIRIGVGNRIFANHITYIADARNFWIHAFHSGLCRLDSTIVDIGSGCGRMAHYLRDYRFKAERFTGKYVGIDIDDEMLNWCRAHFDRERFTFYKSTHTSKTYHAVGSEGAAYALPTPDRSVDFVFSTSLLTHLLENEMSNYFAEAYRVLKPGSAMGMYCFCTDYPPPTLGNRHTFSHRIGNAHVESLSAPEAAVAYEEQYLFARVREAGFSTAELITGPGDWQPMLLCRK